MGVQAAVREGPGVPGLPRAAVLPEGSDAAFGARAAHERACWHQGSSGLPSGGIDRDEEDAYAVFWTTAGRTRAYNFAIVVGADVDYVEVRPTQGQVRRQEVLLRQAPALRRTRRGLRGRAAPRPQGSRWRIWRYWPVFPYFAGDKAESEGNVPGARLQIFTADYVDTVEGTAWFTGLWVVRTL